MRALDKKLLRDLAHVKGQALAIALVIAAGVGMYVMYLSLFSSLRLTLDTYYERSRFAQVFAVLKRAPLALESAIAAIPGVARAETRVVVDLTLDVAGFPEPVGGRLISIPRTDVPRLNDLFLRRGRYPEPDRADEVLVSEGFAEAHGLVPGSRFGALVNGRQRSLIIAGIVLSPEYVYSIRPGDLYPDPRRFGVLWMEREALAGAYDLDGAFNEVSLTLMPGASPEAIIERLDVLLEPYGGLGAFPRAQQTSHFYTDNEIQGLEGAGFIVPVVFLAVAAFLVHVVLTRIVAIEREQIAALKALGYSSWDVGLHYAKWSLLVATAGAMLGVGLGAWMGHGAIGLYARYFRFPVLAFEIPPGVLLTALAVAFAAALAGAVGAVRGAARLPPAEAMRPQAPALYRPTLVERLGLGRFLTEPTRMILRNLERQPVRTTLAITGISFAGAIMVVGSFSMDALDQMLEVQFNVAQRQDLTVTFVEPVSGAAYHELRRLPGVMAAEPLRAVAARLRAGHRSRQLAILGLPVGGELQRVVDASYAVVELPPSGLVLSAKLAELLGVGPGDELEVEVLEGSRPKRRAMVAGLVEESMGTSAYMGIDALRALLREGSTLSAAQLRADPAELERLTRRLKLVPAVASVTLKRAAIDSFRSTIAENIGMVTWFNIAFASVIAFGVIYNNARISLSERGRDLASLRVLGFTRKEISTILLGELALLTLAALPVGLLLGRALAAWTVDAFENELYRIPLVIEPSTYAQAAITVIVASLLSALVVRRRLDRLDLVAVLKTRE